MRKKEQQKNDLQKESIHLSPYFKNKEEKKRKQQLWFNN